MFDRIEEFVIEAREHLGAVEDSLLALEKRPDSTDRVDRCFRAIHSIKGDAGFLGLKRIHELAHAMESLLEQNRPLTALAVIETLLAARDRLAILVDSANRSHLVDISDILQRLTAGGTTIDSIPIDIDLAESTATHSGGLVDRVLEVIGNGRVREGRIQIGPCDLRASLPTGPVRWTGYVETSLHTGHSPSPTAEEHAPDIIRSERISADLSELSKQSGGLCGLFREMTDIAQFVSGRVTFSATDLRLTLPTGPVRWTGECETRLTQAELTRRFGFEFPKATVGTESDRHQSDDVANRASKVKVTHPAPESSPVEAATSKPTSSPQVSESDKPTTLRIQVELLDRMMTLVGELTLVRNQSLLAFADENGTQRAIIQRLNSVTTELQDVTLRARMQPVGNVFNKFPRMVRDLARQLGKQVEIDLQGREVELDKTILEQLGDPLMHLIRNSVDHGIEMPEERIAKGKSPIGRIVLSATHEDGQVHIQIRDDGKGIDPSAVKAKALSLKLKSETELDRMSPHELFSLILLPGFSTATTVTEVSGRGVGMDVVKTNIEQLAGTLDIDSAVDLGCSMSICLPLTLAIIPCLIVTVDADRLAVPLRDLEEVVCLHPRSPGRIEQAFNTEVYRLRENLIPIVRLSEVLCRNAPFTAEAKSEILAAHATDDTSTRTRIEYILVLKLSGRKCGLVVDEVRGTLEIVVKPMHPSMKRVGIFGGATIMGDGRIALIADVEGIIEHAQLSFESALEETAKPGSMRDATQAHRVLLFEYGPHERFALPLLQIRRIEMIAQNRIERVGDHEYVTVEGISTRILRLNKAINVSALDVDPPLMSLILPKFIKRPMGILVSRIVDTESLSLDLQLHSEHDQSILGSAIVRDRLTLFLDMHRLSETLFGISHAGKTSPQRSPRRAKRLLLIDDTAFFREVVKRYLTAEGHEIVTAIHGEDGLAQLAMGCEFDLIVSDIEMPVMDGWEFAREARRRGIQTPMLALTSLSGMQYEVKAKDCGYDSYEVKLDHDRLVRKVGNMLDALEAVR